MQMVKFENGIISDFIDTDQPGHFIELGYVEILPEHDCVQDIRMLKPDWTVRTEEEMYEIGAWQRPSGPEEKQEDSEQTPPTYSDLVTRVEEARKAAYANPQTGSDCLFAEAQRMQIMGEPGWEEVRDAAIARYEEIKSEHPWPAIES